MTFYTKLEGQLIGRGLSFWVEFRWEFLNNSVAVCFSDKIPTKKLKKTRIKIYNKLNWESRFLWYFPTSVVGIFVREIDVSGILSEFHKNFQRIAVSLEFCQSSEFLDQTPILILTLTSSEFCTNFGRNSCRKTSRLRR